MKNPKFYHGNNCTKEADEQFHLMECWDFVINTGICMRIYDIYCFDKTGEVICCE